MHVHTSASDGALSPAEVVSEAVRAGLRAVGVVDHDTLAGIPAAEHAGEQAGVEVIPGVELGCEFHGAEVHIIGYYPDRTSGALASALEFLREERHARLKRMLDALSALGFPIDPERVLEIAGGGVPGRPHVAAAMVENGYVGSTGEAFRLFIGSGCPAYVPRVRLSPEETMDVLTGASSVPVLAHPGSLTWERDPEEMFRQLLEVLVRSGLRGIEAYHPLHSSEDADRYVRLAERMELLVTGGSDFHGSHLRKDPPGAASAPAKSGGWPCNGDREGSLASAVGEVSVPYDLVVRLKQAAAERVAGRRAP